MRWGAKVGYVGGSENALCWQQREPRCRPSRPVDVEKMATTSGCDLRERERWSVGIPRKCKYHEINNGKARIYCDLFPKKCVILPFIMKEKLCETQEIFLC